MRTILFTSALLATLTFTGVAKADPILLPDTTPSFVDSEGQDNVPLDLALDLKDNLSDEEVAQFGRDYNLHLISSPYAHEDGNLEEAPLPEFTDPVVAQNWLDKLEHDPRVEILEPNGYMQALWTPNDPQYSDQWNMERVDAPSTWNYSCGQGTTVAVVDTGVACYDEGGFKKISDLQGTTCVPGANFVNRSVPADDQSHGSHCAGTIAQTTHNNLGVAGLAHCAKIMPVKVLSASGSGSFIAVAEGIRWAADHGAQVINLSLGSSHNSAIAAKAVKYAADHGVFVSCAAGNDGVERVGYPAANEGCFAISASDQKDNLAWFSSYGKEVKIAAPGVGILQQTISDGGKGEGEFKAFNGTSMATPHVAAAAADLMSMGITEPAAVMSNLQGTAIEKTDHAKFGAGILNTGTATRSVFLHHLGIRLGLLVLFGWLVGFWMHKEQKKFSAHPAKFVGALLGSVGLLCFLPLLGVIPHMGAFRWVGDLLSKPFGEWDLIWNVGLHKWLPLANALPIFGLIALGFHRPALKSFVGGLALGTAALLGQMIWSGETHFVLGIWGMRIWAFLNGMLCLWVAKGSLGKSIYQTK